jgi:Spy/CpxP family protein refolding chaperone
MIGIRKSTIVAALLALGAPAFAQAPAATSPPPSKPLSTSLGMVVFPAKGQGAQQQAAEQAAQQQQQATQQQQAAQQEQLDLFKKGFAACLEPKGYTVK